MLRAAEGLDASEEKERARKVALAEDGPRVFESFLKEMGINDMPEFTDEGLSPAEARERAAVERASRKGRFDG